MNTLINFNFRYIKYLESQLIKTDKILREKLSEVRKMSDKINEMKRLLIKKPINTEELRISSNGSSVEALVLNGIE